MKNNDRSSTLQCKGGSGNSEINLTTYIDAKGQENYVTQLKKEGKEVFHVTKHPDGNVYYTDKNGKKKIR